MLLNILGAFSLVLYGAIGITFLVIPPLGVLLGITVLPAYVWGISVLEEYQSTGKLNLWVFYKK